MTTEPYLTNVASVSHCSAEEEILIKGDSNFEDESDTLKVPRRSLVLLNAAAGLDGCDDQMLPASFRAMEHDLSFTPTKLGKITFAQTMTLALSCPIWGFLADRTNRKHILSIGCTLWGVVTVCIAAASTYWQIVVLRMANGFFMGSIGPISQSILADTSARADRGFVFGLIQTCSNFGRVIGGVTTTAIGLETFHGISGWRYSIGTVGVLSMILGLVIARYLPPVPRRSSLLIPTTKDEAKRPINQSDTGGTSAAPLAAASQPADTTSAKTFIKEVWFVSLASRSVWLMFAEGISGMIPWSALSFMTMFFQYCGLTDLQAGVVNGAMLSGAMISGILGGLLGDAITRRAPNHGRPFMAQVSMLLRIPLLVLCFHIVAKQPRSFAEFFCLALGLGVSSFAGSAVNRPILTEVVLPEHRGTVFSIIIALEGAVGSLFGAPLVGFLAEHRFGYERKQMLTAPLEDRQHNAHALGKAIVWLTTIPWGFSFIIYAGLHFCYGADKRRIRNLTQSRARARATASIPIASSPFYGLQADYPSGEDDSPGTSPTVTPRTPTHRLNSKRAASWRRAH